MDKRTLRVALVGCGRIANKHIDALREINNAELVAVCDIDEKKAKNKASYAGLKNFYTSYDQMLKEEAVDIVSILTPSGDHARHAIDIAKNYKKDLVVEKPMALTIDDADSMIRTCDDNNCKLFIVKQNRFNLPVMKLREALEQGRFGKLVMGTVRVRWCRTQDYYDQDDWRGTWAQDGGVITNQAIHHVDLLEWMMGTVDSVYAKGIRALADIETEDTAAVIFKFRNGAIGVLEATTATRPKDLEGSLSILGENGTVEIGGFAVNELVHWEFTESSPEDENVKRKYSSNPTDVYGFGHIEYYKHVVNSILNGMTPLVGGIEGRRSVELISAIYESMETRKEVYLRFKPEYCKLGMRL